MIKINLLPVTRERSWMSKSRTAAPAEAASTTGAGPDARGQILIGIVVVLVFVTACGYRWHMLDQEVTEQTALKATKQQELDALKKQVAEVDEYEKKLRLLEDNNRIIEQLRKNQGGPVRLLDYVSQSLDPLKVWLTSLDEAGPQITIDGKALSNDDVVEFIKNLQRTTYFQSVLLEESRQASEDGLSIYQFKVKMKVKG